jgi:hypothetical protein
VGIELVTNEAGRFHDVDEMINAVVAKFITAPGPKEQMVQKTSHTD